MVFVKNKKVLVFLFLLAFFLSWANLVLAETTPPSGISADSIMSKLLSVGAYGSGGFTPPNSNEFGVILIYYVASILKVVISFLGVIFFLLIIYAGWLWMSAQGNEEQVEKAKKIVSSAILGLALVLFAGTIAVIIFALLKQQILFSSF